MVAQKSDREFFQSMEWMKEMDTSYTLSKPLINVSPRLGFSGDQSKTWYKSSLRSYLERLVGTSEGFCIEYFPQDAV